LLSLGHVHESFFGKLVLLEIGSVEINAALQNWNELLWWILLVIPKDIITLGLAFFVGFSSSNSSEVKNVELAVINHLVGDLDEEASHSLICAVVSCYSVNHLDTIHKSWKSFFNGLWVSLVEWLNKFL